MEITYKFILDKRRESDNEHYPVKLRIYQNRGSKEVNLRIKVRESNWDEKAQEVLASEPDFKLYNAKISSFKSKINAAILLAEINNQTGFKIDDLLDLLKPAQQTSVKAKETVFEFGQKLVAQLEKKGKIGNSIVYSCALNKLKEHCGNRQLYFENIDFRFLDDFNTTLLSDGIKVNTISNYLRTLRAIFNRAIKEKVVDRKYYPFEEFKIKSEKTINRALSIEEMKKIVAVKFDPNSNMWHYQNLFLLSFCFIGINFADLLTLKPENLIDGRIVFHRKKTGKIYSIKIPDEAMKRFHPYNICKVEGKNDFLLPFVKNTGNPVKLKKDIALVIHAVNENLKTISSKQKITKPVSTYYARYSWANIAKSLGYSKDLIAEALGHEYGNKVTGIYLDDYDKAVIDEMNEKVIEAVFYNKKG